MKTKLLLLLTAVLCGCGDGVGVLRVTLDSALPIDGVVGVRATVTSAGNASDLLRYDLDQAISIPPDPTFAVRIDPKHRGAVTIDVTLVDANEKILALGRGDAQIQPGVVSELKLPLSRTSRPLVWQKLPPVTNGFLASVWGTSAGEIYSSGWDSAAGTAILLQSIDSGKTWMDVSASIRAARAFSVWGLNDSDVFVTTDAALYRRTGGIGATWGKLDPLPEGGVPFGIWGSSQSNLFACSSHSSIYKSDDDGVTWTLRTSTNPGTELQTIWGERANLYSVGAGGTIISGIEPSIWADRGGSGFADLNGVWGTSSNDVYAVGTLGTIVHLDDQNAFKRNSGVLGSLNRVWGFHAGDVYVSGDGGTLLHSTDQGQTWMPESVPTTDSLGGIWGSPGLGVFVVGDHGTMLHGE